MSSSGLDVLAAAAADHLPSDAHGSLYSQGPLVKKILALEFIEMSELRGDIWPGDFTTDATTPAQRTPKPPVYQVLAGVLCENGGHFSITSSREGPRTMGITIDNSRGRSQLRGGQLGGIRQAVPS